jgi:hypothetical protein
VLKKLSQAVTRAFRILHLTRARSEKKGDLAPVPITTYW